MNDYITKAAVLLVFGLAMLLLNLKAGKTWLKFTSFMTMLASFFGSGVFVAKVVFFT